MTGSLDPHMVASVRHGHWVTFLKFMGWPIHQVKKSMSSFGQYSQLPRCGCACLAEDTTVNKFASCPH